MRGATTSDAELEAAWTWAESITGPCSGRQGARSSTPTRELYDDYNAAFAKFWKAKTGEDFYRPINEAVAAKYAKQFPKINLVTIRDFGGWAAAQKKHFADGGEFDQIYSTE